ncbi:MAG: hypothetical protein Kow0032_00790 [Methyloligellaceae bacterium]
MALAGLLIGAYVLPAPETAQAAGRCMSWGEARSTGMLKKFTMRPANEIKQRIERKHGGKVVSFQICRDPGGLMYKLAVFRDDGNVIFVTEPAQ